MSWTPRPVPAARPWVAARWTVLAASVVLGLALLGGSAPAGRVFWYGVVPLLPAAFLLNAEIWRNVCPVATLGSLGELDGPVRPLERPVAARAAVLGIALFLLVVPARQLLFDRSPGATLVLLAAAAAAALLGGRRMDRKAGFCNSICPILPVERLYGQRPMLTVANARCAPCRACTRHACFDLNPERSGLVSIGGSAGSGRWVATPFGAFALALPGFVIGYYLNADAAVPLVAYGSVAAGALTSWLVLAPAFALARTRPAEALTVAAALAATAYYWFTPAAVARAWSLGLAWTEGLRAVGLTVVAAWTVHASSRRACRAPGHDTITASVET